MKNKTLLTLTAACLLLLPTSCRKEVETVTLNKATLTLAAGASETLTATVTPAKAEHGALTWTSSNPAVATTDQNGKVTAVANGTAFITVAVAGKTATCKVTVTQDPLPPPPRIERWLLLAAYYDYMCGSPLCYSLDENSTYEDLYDTNKAATFVNWTDNTYYSHSVLHSDGTPPYHTFSGKIFYENGGNPAVFPTIQFESGFCNDQNRPKTTKWELSYYGDYTSQPYQPFIYATAFTQIYNIPNQFVVLHTDINQTTLYFAVFNYPY